MVGRIERVQRPHTPAATDEATLALWYELGRLYSESGGSGQRATKLGFTVVCAVGALVLLSAPVFGTAREGLGAYYDAQLLLLRSEYEYLRDATRTARLFEESFGFTQEDSFETGP